jgi:glycosyltransferase involved in cell wall biosynthesis
LKILYLSHNGVADHIGQSQIAPYLLGLAKLGHDIHLLSLEKPGKDAIIGQYQAAFDAAGIRWTRLRYHRFPPLAAQLFDTLNLRRTAVAIARRERPDVVHCRSYLPIEAGVAVKLATGAKLLIDFRHFYNEGGMKNSRFPFAFRALKKREPYYFAHADHVVALTRKATEILNGWYPSEQGMGRFTVIPCCADFTMFDPGAVRKADAAAARKQLGIGKQDFVLLYLGTIGPEYLIDEMFDLFAELLKRRPDARFLFLCNNGAEAVQEAARRKGVPADRVIVTGVPRSEVPHYLAISSMSVMFFQPGLNLAGCFPTKLSEVFAFNIPVIANAGIGDLDELLDLQKNCSVAVTSFTPEALGQAIDHVLECSGAHGDEIRDNSRAFDLPTGVADYDRIYRKLGAPRLPTGHAVG